jgi:hypothetical protein
MVKQADYRSNFRQKLLSVSKDDAKFKSSIENFYLQIHLLELQIMQDNF